VSSGELAAEGEGSVPGQALLPDRFRPSQQLVSLSKRQAKLRAVALRLLKEIWSLGRIHQAKNERPESGLPTGRYNLAA